jgi:hypothetical protein
MTNQCRLVSKIDTSIWYGEVFPLRSVRLIFCIAYPGQKLNAKTAKENTQRAQRIFVSRSGRGEAKKATDKNTLNILIT